MVELLKEFQSSVRATLTRLPNTREKIEILREEGEV
jgi:hypothetical protein